MPGLFSRFKSAFSIHQGNTGTSRTITAEQPSTFNMLTAQCGFYTTLLGEADDQKPMDVPQKLVQSVVQKTLNDQEKRIKAVPRLPAIIPKLLQSLRDPEASGKDYVDIINKDPAMSTAVLKLANSVYFNPTEKRVISIERAVVKLGVDGLRTALSAAVMYPVIQCKSYHYTEFGHKLWSHSLCCAVACEIIAKQRRLEPFTAYVLGLVHDIGKITLFSSLSKQYKLQADTHKPGYAAFVPLMQASSAQLSYLIAKDWQLPEDICTALSQQIDLIPGIPISPYAHVLYQANLACEIYAIICNDQSQNEAAIHALKDMSLPANLFTTLTALTIDVP